MLDSDVFSYFLRDRQPVAGRTLEYLETFGKLDISVVCHYEVLRGLVHAKAESKLARFERLVARCNVWPFDQQSSLIASGIHAHLRREGLLLPDADIIVAAIAMANRCAVVTNNTSHFRRIPDLEVENWVE